MVICWLSMSMTFSEQCTNQNQPVDIWWSIVKQQTENLGAVLEQEGT